MCLKGATFLPVVYCFGELKLLKSYAWCSPGTTDTGNDITDSPE